MQRVTVNMDDGLAARLAARAALERRSLSQMIVFALEEALPDGPPQVMPADGAGGEEPNGGLRTGDTRTPTGTAVDAPVGPSSLPPASDSGPSVVSRVMGRRAS